MNKWIQNLNKFFEKDSAPGILLIGATITALVVANSPLNTIYHSLMQIEFGLGFEGLSISNSIQNWVNDGLMALFFLLIGVEIKSELRFGRLQSFKSAIFPVVSAMTGALIPALIFFLITKGTDYERGWAIPMATDIAFVIGIIALLGSRMPAWAKIFITTIAVVDDLIAVLVIAVFYTDQINWGALGIGAICVLILLLFNYKRVNKLTPYLIVGFFLWCAILASGIHATIAGVILAFTIPLRREWELDRIKNFAAKGLELFKRAKDETISFTIPQAHYYLEKTLEEMESPLKRMERKLHAPVYFFIMPIFAFVNAGISLDAEVLSQTFLLPITWGTILGLSLGKPIGVMLSIWIFLKFFYKNLPDTAAVWKLLFGLAVLCGMGFTMSLFIVNLSFDDEILQMEAKIGILVASLISGCVGFYLLYLATRNPEAITGEIIKSATKE